MNILFVFYSFILFKVALQDMLCAVSKNAVFLVSQLRYSINRGSMSN